MLQIIGWLLCVYLVVKGFELVAMKHTSAYVGAAIAFLAAPIFFVLINMQSASSAPMDQSGSTGGLLDATTDGPAETDSSAADAAVDEALEEAGRAVEDAGAALESAQQ